MLDAQTRAVRKVLTGFDNYIHSIAFSPDGSLLAAADQNGTLIVWNSRTWRPVTMLHLPVSSDIFGDFESQILRVTFTADGAKLVAAWYNQILICDTHTGQLYMPLVSEMGSFNNVAINPAGMQMAVAFASSMVAHQSLAPKDWQAQACAIAHRNLTRAEWDEQIGTDLPYRKLCADVP